MARETHGTVLLLQVPRTNDKKELAAEQMLASIHGLLLSKRAKGFFSTTVREQISFEIAVKNKRIGFYIWVPDELKSFVEEQIYAQYPTVHISEVDDYTDTVLAGYPTTMAAELQLTTHDALPIKTFPSFEVDPLAAITATLAQFEDNEEAWIQVIVKPATENWYKKSEQFVTKATESGSGTATNYANLLWQPPTTEKAGAPKLSEGESSRVKAAEQKSHKLAYEVNARIVYVGKTSGPQARMRIQAIAASFKQFNTTYLNGFKHTVITKTDRVIEHYQQRLMSKKTYALNIEELASLYHLPHTNVETPNILWASSKTAEPPATLPQINKATAREVSPVGTTNFRGHNTVFGLPRTDRGRHLYIIGQTGVGKSGMLELLTIADIDSPNGFAVIDPHGDYAMNVLRRIPEHRIKDVVYFNPADTDFPIAFNPMEVQNEKLKTHTCSELIGVLKRMFESWGPRLEYILRYSILALLDYPNATMLDITRILTDKKFREEVLEHVQDPVVLNFWRVEFASWNDKFTAEAVSPVLNKVGAFTANPMVRNIIGQPKSSFNIRQIMDERKILIVNLSRGLIGEDNASLLGALLVTKIQLGAMSRADIPAEERAPFYLYVDEFQNFATDSFATILSEARKYGLSLTVANQYIAQMSQGVRDAVFGNVGSIISFRTSADDARIMQKYFEPKFEERDMVHMHNRDFVISMTIAGEKAQAFSAKSAELPLLPVDNSHEIITHSRTQYGNAKTDIDSYVSDRYVSEQKKRNTDSRRAGQKNTHTATRPKSPDTPRPKKQKALTVKPSSVAATQRKSNTTLTLASRTRIEKSLLRLMVRSSQTKEPSRMKLVGVHKTNVSTSTDESLTKATGSKSTKNSSGAKKAEPGNKSTSKKRKRTRTRSRKKKQTALKQPMSAPKNKHKTSLDKATSGTQTTPSRAKNMRFIKIAMLGD